MNHSLPFDEFLPVQRDISEHQVSVTCSRGAQGRCGTEGAIFARDVGVLHRGNRAPFRRTIQGPWAKHKLETCE